MTEHAPKKGPPPAAFWIAIGVAIGCGIGVALRNPVLGLGLAIGVGGMLMSRRKS
jgi:hypothetical protein